MSQGSVGRSGAESSARSAGAGGAAGSGGSPGAGQPSAGGSTAAAGSQGGGAGSAGGIAANPIGAATGLPALTDYKTAGPFTPVQGMGPAGFVTYYPQQLGENGAKHPIVSWGPGAAENAASFSIMLKHLASHGFAVISYDATPEGQELITAIDWMIAENDRSGGEFYQKLDPTRIAAGGHSAGSLATFVIGGDMRLVTTLHISGGTFEPHTDIENLHAPALFVCGEPGGDGLLVGDVAAPNCDIDFMNATVPVFYGITKGASHMTPTDIGDAALRTHQLGAIVGWLRWQLGGDDQAEALFVGDSCGLCMDAAWSTAQSKNLN